MDSSIDPNGYDRLSKISQLHLIKVTEADFNKTEVSLWPLDGSLVGDYGFDPFGLGKPAEYLQSDIDSLDQNLAKNPYGRSRPKYYSLVKEPKIGSSYLGQPLLFSISTLIWIEVLVIGYIELDSEKRLYPGWQVLRPAFSIIMLSYNVTSSSINRAAMRLNRVCLLKLLYLHKQIMTEYTNPLRKNISEAHYGLASLRTCIKLV
ncbi:hypothetical protein YC2023_103701 [Brassica napus]